MHDEKDNTLTSLLPLLESLVLVVVTTIVPSVVAVAAVVSVHGRGHGDVGRGHAHHDGGSNHHGGRHTHHDRRTNHGGNVAGRVGRGRVSSIGVAVVAVVVAHRVAVEMGVPLLG
eukprot:TRINITY_DN12055_c0_g1_i5.p1 TRINITY_DN12055_c0_g1~~TRINITY_DN12055_c0_g1_i5.p1  ORF type:complete len:115 (-),score=9.00 TRINITY_DN12055_c0_g1_i5:86-430(-)